MGEEAIYGLTSAVGGKGTDVTLKVMEQKDSQGRLVAIVSRDGLSVNEQLVADGYAWVARKELKPRVAMNVPGFTRCSRSTCTPGTSSRAARGATPTSRCAHFWLKPQGT